MTQDAIVTKLMPDDMAEVVVSRTTACGSNCGNCESCIFQNELKVLAHNLVNAQPGQRVIIESKSSKVYGAAFMVYIMPLICFFVGYALAYSAGFSELVCVVLSFGALAVGGVILVITQRRKKKDEQISVDIIQLKQLREEI